MADEHLDLVYSMDVDEFFVIDTTSYQAEFHRLVFAVYDRERTCQTELDALFATVNDRITHLCKRTTELSNERQALLVEKTLMVHREALQNSRDGILCLSDHARNFIQTTQKIHTERDTQVNTLKQQTLAQMLALNSANDAPPFLNNMATVETLQTQAEEQIKTLYQQANQHIAGEQAITLRAIEYHADVLTKLLNDVSIDAEQLNQAYFNKPSVPTPLPMITPLHHIQRSHAFSQPLWTEAEAAPTTEEIPNEKITPP